MTKLKAEFFTFPWVFHKSPSQPAEQLALSKRGAAPGVPGTGSGTDQGYDKLRVQSIPVNAAMKNTISNGAIRGTNNNGSGNPVKNDHMMNMMAAVCMQCMF